MSGLRILVVASALLLVLTTTTCTSSRWEFVRERPHQVYTTDVTITTEPEVADVSINGTFVGQSPIIIPIQHKAEVKIYERRRALPYPHHETREVPTFIRNTFEIGAYATGYHLTTEKITLKGEAEQTLHIRLTPR
jgi:hypothetical protein